MAAAAAQHFVLGSPPHQESRTWIRGLAFVSAN